jgi:hypothetical protein
MSHTQRRQPSRSRAACERPSVVALFLVGILSLVAPSVQAAASKLVAADGLVVWVDGPTARLYDEHGRSLGQLPPRVTKGRAAPEASIALPGASNDSARAAAQLLDEMDLSGGDRDDDIAEALIEDELPLADRRQADATAREQRGSNDEAASAVWPAWAANAGKHLFVGAGGAIWRVQTGRAPVRLGRAPMRTRAAVVTADQWLILVGDQVLGSRDGRAFHGLAITPPLDVVADGRSPQVAFRYDDRIEVVNLATGKSGHSLTAGERATFTSSAPVRDLAVCSQRLVALTDDGLFARSPLGDFGAVDLTASGIGLACDGDRGVIFGLNGFHAMPDPTNVGGARVGSSATAVGDIESATFVDQTLWLATSDKRLVRLAWNAKGEGNVTPVDRVAAVRPQPTDMPASPLPSRASPPEVTAPRTAGHRRSRLPDLLPELAFVGRVEALSQRRRAVGLALVANWRLGRTRETFGRPIVADAAALATFAGAPAVGSFPTGGSATGAPPPPTMPVLGPDPDVGCLHTVRQKAVALASADAGQAQSLVTRAGRSAWLPEVRLRAERRVGRSESVDFKPTAANDALGLDTVSDVRYEVRAIWDLPRLVFNPEELGAHQQAARIADMRREIESQVNRLYFERRRLLAVPPDAAEEAATWQIRLEEIEADLDALSGGGFSRCRGGILHPRPSRS